MKHIRAHIGILDDTHGSLGGGQLMAAQTAVMLACDYTVELIHTGETYSLDTLTKAFALDLAGVTERIIRLKRQPWYSFGLPGIEAAAREVYREARNLTRPYDLFIYFGHGVPPFCYAKYGLMYCHFPFQRPPLEVTEAAPGWKRRNRLDRLLRRSAYRLLWQVRMQRYGTILANSAFTAGWIRRRWGRKAEVVAPPVEVSVPVVDKKNIIVSVGRFWGAKMGSKNQLEQVTAFRKFLDAGGRGWQLYLIGSCYSEQDQAYLACVQKAAEGLPVRFLVNVNRDAVCQVLAEAKIFWHTLGLSVDESKHPEAAEHFGIATVEGMRATCVPIVIASGGQREIVKDGLSGYLCESLDELVQRTIGISRDQSLLATMSVKARERSMAFTREAFEERITEIVARRLHRRLFVQLRSQQKTRPFREAIGSADPVGPGIASHEE